MSTPRREERLLSRIVSTVTSTLELDDVLRAVVQLLSEGTGVNACFVYLLDQGADRLVLRAASPGYEQLVGQAGLDRGRGIAWWAAEQREPVFLRDDAASDDRFELVEGIDEERFQSFLAVPLVARPGRLVGVITAHTQAPREFSEAEVEFLVSGASLVAGAIDNARAYDDSRRRVEDLERLTALAEALARATSTDELAAEVASRAVELLRARAALLYLHDGASDEVALQASAPLGQLAPGTLRVGRLGPELVRRERRITVPLVSSGELVGVLVAQDTTNVELARTIAGQAAVAMQKIRLIERLADRSLVADVLDDLAAGIVAPDDPRLARLGHDGAGPHVVVLSTQPANEVAEALGHPPLLDGGEAELRVVVAAPGGHVAVAGRLHDLSRTRPGSSGLSGVFEIGSASSRAFTEARHALVAAALPGAAKVVVYDELGPLRYLLPATLAGGVRDPLVEAVDRLREYDERRGTELLLTLESYLRHRGSLRATADALFVHVNTLRQRLDRIAEVSGIDPASADGLSLELALLSANLRRALSA